MRGVEESGDGSPMVCESVDPEDPYAIDQTSISDSLVMFMRSKQSVAELRKGAAMSGVVASSESAAAGAKSIIEVSLSVEAPLCSEAKDIVEGSDVAVGSSKTSDVVPDPVSSEECTFEAREAAEGMSCEDGKGRVSSESLEIVEGRDVEGSNECGRQDVPEVLGSGAVGGLHTCGHGNSGDGVGEDVELRNADLSGVDVVVCVRRDTERVGVESREDHALNAADSVGEFGNRAVKYSIVREVGLNSEKVQWVGSGLSKVLRSETESVARRSIGESPYDMGQFQSLWLVRTGRFISRSIGTNLVNIDCTIPGQHLALWMHGIDNVWRCVPYLTLFVDVMLEGDRSKRGRSPGSWTRCYGEESAKGISLRRNVLSAVFSRIRGYPGLTCPHSALGNARVVVHGSRTPSGVSNSELLLRQGNDSELVEGSIKANSLCSELQFAVNDGMLVERPCDPIVVEQAVSVVGLPGLDILDSRGQKLEHRGHFVPIDMSSLLHVETDASESYPAAPSPDSPEVSLRFVVTGRLPLWTSSSLTRSSW